MWLALGSLAYPADVLVFGDSWAEGSADELADALQPYGLTVAAYGIGGTTADQYANQYPWAIPDTLALHPEARWVWLSMGGNDLFANYVANNGANNGALYNTNFRTVLDQVAGAGPDLRVVSFGYDFVNFEQSTECIAQAWYYFGTGTLTPTINGYFLADIRDVLSGIDPDYFRYTHVGTLWGTLQAAGGLASAPDPNYPSPASYMSDCIHPTSEGYRIIHAALVDAYWGVAPPVAGVAGKDEVCAGDDEHWRDTSRGATDSRWLVDGVEVGAESSLVWTFAAAGTYTVTLQVAAGAWEDEASRAVVVSNCAGDTGAAGDSGSPDSGNEQHTGGAGSDSGEAPGDSDEHATNPPATAECGCDGAAARAGLWGLVGALAALRRRGRRLPAS